MPMWYLFCQIWLHTGSQAPGDNSKAVLNILKILLSDFKKQESQMWKEQQNTPPLQIPLLQQHKVVI